MSSKRTGVKALVLVAGASLALTACTSGGGGSTGTGSSTDAGKTKNITFTWAYEQEFGSYNNNTADQNASKNAIVLNQVLRGFWYFSPKGEIVPDKEFGSFEKTSDNPLTVKYTFAKGAQWSDGVPIECSDAVLTWAANNGQYKTGQKDKDGNDITAFSSAGTTGYEDMEQPQCKKGDTSFTVKYTKNFADWQSMFGANSIMPAHIVEKGSGVSDLISAVTNKDLPSLIKAGDYYNNAWIAKTPGQFDKSIYLSAGPYMIDAWQAGQSITLKPNPKWWGKKPTAGTVVIRFISQEQQAQALQNGEIQAMDPQPNADLKAQLDGMKGQVNVSTHDQYTFEHYDFNFNTLFKDKRLREAFAKCLPRQDIIDKLIKPQNPNAAIMNSRYIFPFQTDYKEVASAIVGTKYDKVDIAGAKALLQQAGQPNPTVRIGYKTPNQRRTQEVDLIRASCGQAGFNIQDIGSEDFFGNGLANGNFDVALFAWAGSPLVTGSSSTYVTNGGNNNGKYSNPEVDKLITQLNGETDLDKQKKLIIQVEKILWDDLATIPAFAFPGILATSKNALNVEFNATQADLSWNMQAWDLKQ